MQSSTSLPALYSQEIKALSGTPFRLLSTDSTLNTKSSYLWFQLNLDRFYGVIPDPEGKPWDEGNHLVYNGDKTEPVPFDFYRLYTFRIPVGVSLTTNDGTPIPAGRDAEHPVTIHGKMKTPNDKPWTAGNFVICLGGTWKMVGKGSRLEGAEWKECDFDRLREFELIDKDSGKPRVDKPEKVTTFKIAFQSPVTVQRKEKDGTLVGKEMRECVLEAGHYLALRLKAKIKDKSEDNGNPLQYWLTWTFDPTKTDNATKWDVTAKKMTDEETTALQANETHAPSEPFAGADEAAAFMSEIPY